MICERKTKYGLLAPLILRDGLYRMTVVTLTAQNVITFTINLELQQKT